MKRLPRASLDFDGFDLLAHYAQGRRLSLRDGATIDRFLADIREANERRLRNDAFVHGRRVEAMFESVVASLGRVVLIKQEDTGEAFYSGAEVKAPDFRVVAENGDLLLIEVKSHYQKGSGLAAQIESIDYLDKLQRYATITKSELLFATYWTRWNMWTLVSRSAFEGNGPKVRLSMKSAWCSNQMSRVGDRLICTRPPLRFRIHVKEVERRGDVHTVLIEKVELLSEDRVLVDPCERELASLFVLYGGWQEEQDVRTSADGAFLWIDHVLAPSEDRRRQDEHGFEMIGALSAMLSREFRNATATDDRVDHVRHEVKPGRIARLLPEDLPSGGELPLWILEQRPSPPEDVASPPETKMQPGARGTSVARRPRRKKKRR